jgi:hypothetical protein
LSTSFYSAPYSIQSSLSGSSNYLNNNHVTISTSTPIDLTTAQHAYLYFYTKWNVETGSDYAYVNAAIDGTTAWAHLCGKYTRIDPYSGAPVYDGMQEQWVREEIGLQDYIGKKINIQFELESDPFVNYKGFYFDDMGVIAVVDSPLAVQDLSAGHSLGIYPNPAGDELNITVGHVMAEPMDAVVYDCLGREAMHFTIDKPSVKLNVSNLPTGMYYLRSFEKGRPQQVQKVNIIR